MSDLMSGGPEGPAGRSGAAGGGPASSRRGGAGGYAGRREEVRRLRASLAEAKYPEERAQATGALLAAAGDLLRRSKAVELTGGKDEVSTALGALTREDVAGWLQTVTLDAVRGGLSRALDDAFEAALSDTAEEREALLASAFTGLSLRDRLESSLAAIARWETFGTPLTGVPLSRREAIRRGLGQLDAALQSGARSLVPLNDARRAERDLLDDEPKQRAWWYGARADCDDLLALLTAPGAHVTHCEACRRDAEKAKVVEAPPVRHATADDLWKLDAGLMTAEETSWITRHAARCAPCKQALRALSDGEQAIEAESDAPRRRPAAALVEEPRPREEVVLLEHHAFRAVLVRAAKRLKVRIELRQEGLAMTARLTMPGSPSPLKPRQTAFGVEFNLGNPHRLGGQQARLLIELPGEAKPIELDCPL